MFGHSKNTKSSERGMALALAIMVLLVVSTIVAGMVIMSGTESNISGNFRQEQSAFFAARAGLEEGRDRLRTTATGTLTTTPLFTSLAPTTNPMPGQANGILYVTNALSGETVTPWNTTADPQWGTGTPHYPDDEICKELGSCTGTPAVPPGGSTWYTTVSADSSYAATPKLPWKWVRVMSKVNKSVTGTSTITSVDSTTSGNRVCWNGQSEFVIPNTIATCNDAGGAAPVFEITALAVTPNGTRRMLQYEETLNVNIPIVAAMYAKNNINGGQALNVTGKTDSACTGQPPVYAAASGQSVILPGGGNFTGCPPSDSSCGGTKNSYSWNLYIPNVITSMTSSLSPTNITTVSGIQTLGTSPNNSYTLPSGQLGVPPTVVRDASGAITSITSPGTPATYITPDLTVSPATSPATYNTLTLGGTAPGFSGQGVLIVRGNLTMDFGQPWNYYGLIIVLGDITMINTGNGTANPDIHGAILAGGAINANGTGMGSFSGSISIHQNACMVNNVVTSHFYKTLAQRELLYQ